MPYLVVLIKLYCVRSHVTCYMLQRPYMAHVSSTNVAAKELSKVHPSACMAVPRNYVAATERRLLHPVLLHMYGRTPELCACQRAQQLHQVMLYMYGRTSELCGCQRAQPTDAQYCWRRVMASWKVRGAFPLLPAASALSPAVGAAWDGAGTVAAKARHLEISLRFFALWYLSRYPSTKPWKAVRKLYCLAPVDIPRPGHLQHAMKF